MYYYPATLSATMVIVAYKFFKSTDEIEKKELNRTLLAYASFFPTSVFVLLFLGTKGSFIASVMCGFAIIAAFIIHNFTTENREIDEKRKGLLSRVQSMF
ncbi:MAG: hypothetical protein Q9M91_08680 [Candidatus Dojkabacteria bacterium]|nr:hypothetical protein [Candidatus Dojkabacteria bacterium]MDQ7021847.1 hypothetical protein [Candidatus Dojkabacteria bacterium]